MGNLGKAGFGATTEGMWPYSYDTCDIGTFPNQSNPDLTPDGALHGGREDGPLSFLPGQKLSACTCPGSDHPGPTVNTGRGAPEIDIIEADIDTSRWVGRASQSLQLAPYNFQYKYNNETPATTIHDTSRSKLNTYTGGVFQQALSALTDVDNADWGGNSYGTYGYEYWSDPKHRDDGYITWYSGGEPSWTLTADSLQGDPYSTISSRIVPEEPMYILLNLGMAPSFQQQDYKHLVFPGKMYVDYVRVYQRDGVSQITCDPDNRPTAKYIQDHLPAYSNPNFTTWAQAGYGFPHNEKYDGCS
jgi:beta-glucanase (GH16 family)